MPTRGCGIFQRLHASISYIASAIVAAILVALALQGTASAATLIVTNTNDDGSGSLRQAITDAAPGDTITFDAGLAGQTITLTTGQLSINKYLTIDGPASGITISGNDSSRVFQIGPGVVVSMSFLTIANGAVIGTNGAGVDNHGTLNLSKVDLIGNNAGTSSNGGAVANSGVLNMTDGVISQNIAGSGGGIDADGLTGIGSTNLTNVSMTDNSAIFSVSGDGGALNNRAGSMHLSGVTISGNSAIYGGGVFTYAGQFVANDVTITGNHATRTGGGIQASGNVSITTGAISGNTAAGGAGMGIIGEHTTLTNVVISGNQAEGPVPLPTGNGIGGGILNQAELALNRVTVSDNSAIGSGTSGVFFGVGGGIFNLGTVTITRSAFSRNTVHGGGNGGQYVGSGGGVFNLGGDVSITNSTVSANSALPGGGGTGTFASGGGLFNTGAEDLFGYPCCATMRLTNVTVSDNNAQNAGGIFNSSDCCGGSNGYPEPTPTLLLTNTIVANQVASADCMDPGPITSVGYNLDSDGTCNLTAAGDIPNTDPLLESLALNLPGTTETHALQAGSPAADRVPTAVNGCGTSVNIDQRGVPRPQLGACDIGAYEVAAPMPSGGPVGGGVEIAVSSTLSDGSPSNTAGRAILAIGALFGVALRSRWGRRYRA